MKTAKKHIAILTIQSDFRMRRILSYYRDIRSKTIKIQRAWKKYYSWKTENLRMVEDMFQEE